MAAILLVAGLAWGPGRRWPTASFALSVLAFVGYWLLGGMPALCLLFSLGCLPLLVWGYGRLPLELWLFGSTSVMAYLLKQNTISLERHVFATVPLLMLYGAWFSAHPRWLGFVLGFGSLLSVIYSVRFAQADVEQFEILIFGDVGQPNPDPCQWHLAQRQPARAGGERRRRPVPGSGRPV
jgi:hypothetical protein